MKSIRGFSLLELLISLVLTSVIFLATSQVYVMIASMDKKVTADNSLTQDLVILIQKIRRELNSIGGDIVNPWDVIYVNNNCTAASYPGLPACGKTDQLTVANLSVSAAGTIMSPASVTSYNSGTSKITFNNVPSCPVDATMVKKHVILISNRVLAGFLNSLDLVNCTGQLVVDNQTKFFTTALAADTFAGGYMYFLDPSTLYLDTTTNKLYSFTDTDNSGTINPGESRLLASGVYDFQVGLGYDTDLDHIIKDNANTTDEILYNAVGDSMATIGGVGATPSQLRQIYFSVVMGTPLLNFKNQAFQFMDGPQVNVNDVLLVGLVKSLYLRNINVFF